MNAWEKVHLFGGYLQSAKIYFLAFASKRYLYYEVLKFVAVYREMTALLFTSFKKFFERRALFSCLDLDLALFRYPLGDFG